MTTYGLTKHQPRADEREKLAEFDGVTILSLPRMAEDGAPLWTRITPGSHGDDAVVKMETSGARYGATQRWDHDAHARVPIAGMPRWEGRVVVYATARWQPGDVVKAEVWQSLVHGEARQWWRLIWTATPPAPGRVLAWVEQPGGGLAWGQIEPDALFVAPVEGGPAAARMTGALVVAETGPDDLAASQRVFSLDEDEAGYEEAVIDED